MNGRSSAIGKDASGRWSKSCSVWPALCTRTIACGRGAVDQRERHRRVGRVVERALALDDHPVAAPLALLDHPLDGALGEVADQPVDRDAPALDHHPGLAGRDERRLAARLRPRPLRELQPDGHLADRAVRADGEDHPLARAVAAPDGRLRPRRRPAVVDDPRPGRRGRGRELRVVAEERVEPGVDVEARPGSRRGSSPASRPAACRRSGRSRSGACRGAARAPAPRRGSPRSGCRGRAGSSRRCHRPGSSR